MAALWFTYQVNGFINDPCLIKTLLALWDVLGIDIRAAFRAALKYCRYFSYSGAQFLHSSNVWFFPHHTKLMETSWVSYNSARFWHCLFGDSTRRHRLRIYFYKNNTLPVQTSITSQVIPSVSEWPSEDCGFNDTTLPGFNLPSMA